MLTRKMREVLTWMATETANREFFGYLTQEGGEVWWGVERTNVKLLHNLLRHCLISERENSGGDRPVIHYAINEDGLAALKDPGYIARIDRLNYGEA